MNKIILIGRITADPELRQTTSNVPAVQFTLAVSRNFKNQNGEIESDFIRCVGYRKTAELINTYVKKGNRLAIEGRLQTRTYEKDDGTKVNVSEVMIDAVEFVQDAKSRNSNENTPAPSQNSNDGIDVYKEFGTSVKASEIDDSDLPF